MGEEFRIIIKNIDCEIYYVIIECNDKSLWKVIN